MINVFKKSQARHRAPRQPRTALRLRPATPAVGAAVFLLGGVLTLCTFTVVGAAVAFVGMVIVAGSLPPEPTPAHEQTFFAWDQAAA